MRLASDAGNNMNIWERFKRLTLWNKIGAVGAVCSVVGLACWLLFRDAGTSVNVKVNDSPGANVQSAVDSPGATQVIAENVTVTNVSRVPKPKLSAMVAYANKPQDGKYVTSLRLTLDSAYPIPQLYVEAHAPTIERVDIRHERPGIQTKGPWGKRDGCAWNRLTNANGKVEVKLVSAQPEKFDVRYDFIE